MTDRIRVDKITVVRPSAVGDRQPVVVNADGGFEVRDPTPIPFPLVKTALAANTTGQGVNHLYSTSSVTALLLPVAGRLVGVSVACQTAIAAGTITVKPQRAGSTVAGSSLVLTAPDQRKTVWWGYAAGFPYAATDTFGLLVDTDSGYTQAAQNVIFELFFAMQP